MTTSWEVERVRQEYRQLERDGYSVLATTIPNEAITLLGTLESAAHRISWTRIGVIVRILLHVIDETQRQLGTLSELATRTRKEHEHVLRMRMQKVLHSPVFREEMVRIGLGVISATRTDSDSCRSTMECSKQIVLMYTLARDRASREGDGRLQREEYSRLHTGLMLEPMARTTTEGLRRGAALRDWYELQIKSVNVPGGRAPAEQGANRQAIIATVRGVLILEQLLECMPSSNRAYFNTIAMAAQYRRERSRPVQKQQLGNCIRATIRRHWPTFQLPDVIARYPAGPAVEPPEEKQGESQGELRAEPLAPATAAEGSGLPPPLPDRAPADLWSTGASVAIGGERGGVMSNQPVAVMSAYALGGDEDSSARPHWGTIEGESLLEGMAEMDMGEMSDLSESRYIDAASGTGRGSIELLPVPGKDGFVDDGELDVFFQEETEGKAAGTRDSSTVAVPDLPAHTPLQEGTEGEGASKRSRVGREGERTIKRTRNNPTAVDGRISPPDFSGWIMRVDKLTKEARKASVALLQAQVKKLQEATVSSEEDD